MSLEFLAPDAAVASDRFTPLARSPMEQLARAAGARFEVRDGWNVAVGYASAEQESDACRQRAAWADVSHLGKLELQASPEDLRAIFASCADGAVPELCHAVRSGGAWWCPLTPTRALVICEPARLPALRERLAEATTHASATASVVDVTTVLAALTITGPLAREVFARFSALDLRPAEAPVHCLRPGSVARQPAILVHEAEQRYLVLFGWAVGEYMWTVIEDAAKHLGGIAVGVDALEPLGESAEEVRANA